MNDDIHDLVTGYVLDELSDGESAAFKAHLESCPDCRGEVVSLRQVAIELALEQANQPPRHLKAKVLAAVARTPQEGARIPQATPIRRRRRWIPAGIAAAVVVIALLGWSMLGTERLINSILDDPLAVTIEATAGAGEFAAARVVFSEDRGAAVLVVDGLNALPSDRIYELWLVDGEEVLPAGLFNTGLEGNARVLIEGEVRPGMVVAVTEEPAGGVDLPTGEILFSAPLDA
jgi:anti-sigma-K factor RskA